MIYKIRIVSDEVDDFRRDILIDSEATFEDLKNVICECTGFNPNLMSSFYICEDNWEKVKEITFEDMGADMTKDLFLMSDTRLDDMISDVGQKMLFTFDFLGDRSLFLQVKDEEFGVDIDGPKCIISRGEAPAQEISIEELEDIVDASSKNATELEMDEDFLGSTDFDEEEIRDFDEMDY